MVVATCLAGSSQVAASNVAVSLQVASTTTLSATACTSGTAATTIGTVLPGTTALATGCDVTFGSSNDTSTLRMRQDDGAGDAMFRPTVGALDTTAPFVNGVAKEAARVGDQGSVGVNWQGAGLAVLESGTILQGAAETTGDSVIVGYLPSGARNTMGWGASGFLTVDFGGTADHVHDLEARANGTVLAAGFRRSGDDESIVRNLTSAGATNSSFGTLGTTIYDAYPATDDWVTSIVELPDASIVVAGMYDNGPAWDSFVFKLDALGNLDTNFATGGRFDNAAVTDINLANPSFHPRLAVQSDDTILLMQHNGNDAIVTALTPYGELDAAWGAAGRRIIDPGAAVGIWSSLVIDDQDRAILAGGQASAAATVARLTATGVLDPGFAGGAGFTTMVPTGAISIFADLGLLTEHDGSIYVSGDASFGGLWRVWVGKLRPDGTGVDTSFGSSGYRIIDYGAGVESNNGGMAWQDGRILLGGTWNPGADRDLVLARLSGTASISDYGGSALWSSGATQSLFGVCLETITNGAAVWNEAPGVAGCSTTDAAHWRGVPRTSGPAARVATASAGVATAVARITFGVKLGTTALVGAYRAPLSIEVVAPGT